MNRNTNSILGLPLLMLLAMYVVTWTGAQAQEIIAENFSSLSNWTADRNNGTFTPSVTGNWLRLNDDTLQQATYAVYNQTFSSANSSIYVDFLFRFYGGTASGGKKGDGITFFLYDSSQNSSSDFTTGFYGGSLGYANLNHPDILTPGMPGGYLGIGVDQFGNYSNSWDEVANARNGGPGVVANSVAVRGPGSGQTGYEYLGGTSSFTSPLWTDTTTPPTSGDGFGHMIISISPTNQVTVSLARDSTTTPTVILSMDLSGYARPENIGFGFTGSTGGATSYHEISQLTFASIPSHRWDNSAGTSAWGTAANWDGTIVPLDQSDVMLDNSFVSSAQTIDLGTTREVRTLFVDAPFNYTLDNGTLAFNGGSSSSTSGLLVSASNGSGATQHTVNSAVTMANNISLSNNSTALLSMGGTISNGGNILTLAGTGNIDLNGVVSGTGALIKTGTGTALLNAANTYTGETKISEGILKLGAADRISDSSNLNVNGGTLNLNGYSEQVGNLTFANGTIDFGTTGTTNAFLFGNTYGSPSGVITIQNWEDLTGTANDDVLATQNGTLSSAILSQFYFSGYGTGATLSSTGETIGSYGSGWYRLTPVAATWYTWDGQTSNAWGTGTNWNPDGTGAPPSGANIIFGTTTAGNRSVALGANRTVSAIRFEEGTTSGGYNIGNNVATYSLTLGGTGTAFIQQRSNDYAQTISAPVVVQNNSVIDMIGSQTLTVSGALSGSSNLVKEGTGGKLLLSGNSTTYAGNIYINAGTIQISNANALGNTTGKTIIADGATLEVAGGITTAEAIDIDGNGVSGGGVIKNFSGNNTLSGTITLTDAARLTNDATGTTMTVSGSVLSNTGRDINVTGVGNVTLTGAVSTGSGGLAKDGTGTLTLSGNNTFRGALGINAGTVVTTANERINDAVAVQMAGGTLNLAGYTETIGSLAGTTGSVTLGAGTLNVGGNNTSTTFSGTISGTNGILTKSGTGTLTLTAANSYTGATNINAGGINIQNATGLGTTAAGTTVASGGQLQLQGGIAVGAEALTLSGTGLSNTGALYNVSGNNSYAGAITLTGATRINSNADTLTLNVATGNGIASAAAQNLTFGGAGNITVSDAIATGAGSVTKDGGGTLTLSAANTFTGGFTVDNGTVALGGTNRLATSNAVTVNAGTLNLQNYGQTVGSLAGTGGTVALGSATLNTGGANTTTSYAGVISGTGGALTKAGTGSMTLSGANSYTGATSISAGTLIAENATSLGTTAAGTTVTTGATLGLQGSIAVGAETLSLAGTGVGTGGALRNYSGDNSYAGAITLTAATRINSDSGTLTLDVASGNGIASAAAQNLTFGGAGDITVNDVIATQAGSLTKDGAGTLTLNAANTYSGATTISQGIVKIGGSNVISNGAFSIGGAGELHLQGNSERVGAMTVSNLAGGVIDYGTTAGNNYMVGSSLAFTDTAAVLTISNFVFDDTSNTTARDFNLSDIFAVAGTTAPANLANVYFYGYGVADATASGAATNVPSALGGTWYALIPALGSVGWTNWVSTSSTAWGTAANWNPATVPNSTTAKVAFQAGTYQTSVNLGGLTRRLNSLRFDAGSSAYTLSNGTLRFGGTGFAVIQQRSTSTQTISAGVRLDNDTVVDISDSGNLVISGVVSNVGDLRRGGSGSGILELSGNNTVAGAILLESGATRISNANALGATTTGTTVSDGAQLQIAGGITTAAEALSMRGSGLSDTGALLNVSGNNTYSGAITITGATRINSDSGTLTLNVGAGNAIASAAAQNLTFGGAGNVTVSDAIATGAGTVTKDGAGTLTLGAANTFTGAVSVSEGALNIQNANALGTTAGGATVSSGAELQLQGGISFAGESLNIAGTGTSSTGALRNISGNNTWTGAVNLDSAARINSDSGTLTVSGNISGSEQNLTVGGSGNTTVSGVIGTGAGSVTKDGSGTLTLSASNTYTGGTTINAGTVSLNAANRLADAGAVTVNTGGTLALNNYSETIGSLGGTGGSVALGSGMLTAGGDNSSTTYAGVISGTSGQLTKTGTGTLALTGTNTYTGATTVNQGTLQLGANNVLADTSALSIVSGATFDLNGYTDTVGNINSTGGTLNIAGGSLTVGNTSASTFNGALTGTGTLTSQGTGGLTFTSNVNFGGTVVVNSGNTVEFASGATINSLTLAGGTLKLSGSNTLNINSLTITGTSTIDFGSGSVTIDVGTLTTNGTNSVTVNNWTSLQDWFFATNWVKDGTTYTWDSAPNRGQTPLDQVVFSGYGGSSTAWLPLNGHGHGHITPVPEPSTYGVIFTGSALGLFGLLRYSKRRKEHKP